ncbi:MAG: hypothetical protein V4718_06870 [Pseudomonadota bacterium]
MKACGWDLYDFKIAEFREARLRLPAAINVQFKSCSSNGPRYLIKTPNKTVALQDGWLEGDKSTSYSFAKEQPAPDYWVFSYRGYEWSGMTFVNKQTGALKNTPGNSCGAPAFNSSGNRLLVRCVREYGQEESDLYFVGLGSEIKIKNIDDSIPEGELAVIWKNPKTVIVGFVTEKRTVSKTYRIP